MYCVKLSKDAITPKIAIQGDAGYDLYTTESLLLKTGKRHGFKTDISLAIPDNYYGRIAPRSGLAFKHGIDVLAGVIDKTYRSEIKVILINHGETDYQVTKGDRIAQIILTRIETPELLVVDKLPETIRDGGCFGSTGK